MLKFVGYIVGLLGVALLVRHVVAYFMGKSGLSVKGLLAAILLTLVGAFIIKKSRK
jgi:hypothetical protein